MNLEAKGRRVTQVCLDPEGHQGPPEILDEMAQGAILVMLDQEASLAVRDQKEILEDLALAILDQGAIQEKRVIRESVDHVGAEGTVDRRATPARRGVQEKRVSLAQMENLVLEVHKGRGAALEILDPREIPASQNVM